MIRCVDFFNTLCIITFFQGTSWKERYKEINYIPIGRQLLDILVKLAAKFIQIGMNENFRNLYCLIIKFNGKFNEMVWVSLDLCIKFWTICIAPRMQNEGVSRTNIDWVQTEYYIPFMFLNFYYKIFVLKTMERKSNKSGYGAIKSWDNNKRNDKTILSIIYIWSGRNYFLIIRINQIYLSSAIWMKSHNYSKLNSMRVHSIKYSLFSNIWR